MIDIKRLHKIMEEKGSDPDVTMHDLVREVLKRDYDLDDYSLENISRPVEEDGGSTVHENLKQVEIQFKKFQDQDDQAELTKKYDKEATLFETIELLKSKAQNGWTHLIKKRPSNEN